MLPVRKKNSEAHHRKGLGEIYRLALFPKNRLDFPPPDLPCAPQAKQNSAACVGLRSIWIRSGAPIQAQALVRLRALGLVARTRQRPAPVRIILPARISARRSGGGGLRAARAANAGGCGCRLRKPSRAARVRSPAARASGMGGRMSALVQPQSAACVHTSEPSNGSRHCLAAAIFFG